MKMTLDAWGRSVDGQLIDRDGSAGAQCWDLWADYAERAVGVPIGWTYTVNRPSHPDHYLASSMWLFFPTPRVGDLAKYFVRLGRDAVAQAGDVAVWARSSAYLASHIAVATGPAVGGMLPCWTQNPGATKHEWLTTAGLLGYLRPIALMGTPSAPSITTESEEDEDMANQYIAKAEGGKQINAIFNTQSGFFHEFESKDGVYNTAVARTFGVKDPTSMVSVSHYNAVKRDAASLRAGKA